MRLFGIILAARDISRVIRNGRNIAFQSKAGAERRFQKQCDCGCDPERSGEVCGASSVGAMNKSG